MQPKNNLLNWKLLESLERTGNLTQACIENDCDLSTASRRLAALEEDLGVSLLDRRRKPMQPTRFVKTNLSLIRRIVRLHDELLEEAAKELSSRNDKFIRFGLTTSAIVHGVVGLINKFNTEYPDIEIQLVPDMDHTSVMNKEVDISLVPYEPKESELTVLPIGQCFTLLVASPAYLAKRGEPKIITDLNDQGHTLLLKRKPFYPEAEDLVYGNLIYDFYTGQLRKLKDNKEGAFGKKGAGKVTTKFVGDQNGYISALSGEGIAVDLPLSFIKRDLMGGSLVPVLKGWKRKPWSRNLVVHKENSHWEELHTFARWFQLHERIDSHQRWNEMYQFCEVPGEAYANS